MQGHAVLGEGRRQTAKWGVQLQVDFCQSDLDQSHVGVLQHRVLIALPRSVFALQAVHVRHDALLTRRETSSLLVRQAQQGHSAGCLGGVVHCWLTDGHLEPVSRLVKNRTDVVKEILRACSLDARAVKIAGQSSVSHGCCTLAWVENPRNSSALLTALSRQC